jgi:hypothetical protein
METFKRDQLISNYVDLVLDNMDTKTLMQIVGDEITDNLSEYTDEELISEIEDHYPELLN